MTMVTTRRAVFGSAAAVGIALIAPVASSTEQPGSNRRLLRAIALRDKAAHACEQFDVDVEMPARTAQLAALDAAMANAPPPVPHEAVKTTFVNLFGDDVLLSTENVGSVGTSRRVVNDPTCADMGDEDWRTAHHELVILAEKRGAAVREREAQCDAIRVRVLADHRIGHLMARAETLANREYALWAAVLTMPATSLSDIGIKLEFAARTDREDPDFVLVHVGNDVRRLVSTGGKA